MNFFDSLVVGNFFDSILGSILILLNPILAVIEAVLNLFSAVGDQGLL